MVSTSTSDYREVLRELNKREPLSTATTDAAARETRSAAAVG
jgi:hypothetical protein